MSIVDHTTGTPISSYELGQILRYANGSFARVVELPKKDGTLYKTAGYISRAEAEGGPAAARVAKPRARATICKGASKESCDVTPGCKWITTKGTPSRSYCKGTMAAPLKPTRDEMKAARLAAAAAYVAPPLAAPAPLPPARLPTPAFAPAAFVPAAAAAAAAPAPRAKRIIPVATGTMKTQFQKYCSDMKTKDTCDKQSACLWTRDKCQLGFGKAKTQRMEKMSSAASKIQRNARLWSLARQVATDEVY